MDDTTYSRWWQLHRRVAGGDRLHPVEQTEYEAGLAALDHEEKGQQEDAGLSALRKLKAEVERLEMAQTQLQSKSHRLDRQIWTLEGAYMMLTGLELGNQDYVSSPV